VINVKQREGKALGSEEGKALGSGLSLWLYVRGRNLSVPFTAVEPIFYVCIGETAREDSSALWNSGPRARARASVCK
jgi:hypothetical protein